ncbi:MAG: hypothetical protein QOD51_1176 [Candidatus Eremiobacteraeota bacterium]|nr:hypothetical protein [Candidatus Eremiobacteraeota bacterium]
MALTVAQLVAEPAGGGFSHVGPTPPPHGYPAIKSVNISTTDVHAGRPVHGAVETSDNVHYVEARIEYRAVAMHQDAPGKFSLTYKVPWWLPPWLRHGYTLQIIARSIDGVETAREIPITVH